MKQGKLIRVNPKKVVLKCCNCTKRLGKDAQDFIGVSAHFRFRWCYECYDKHIVTHY